MVFERNKKIDELQQIESVLQTHIPQLMKKDTKSGAVHNTRATVAFSLLGDLIDECVYDVSFQVHRDLKKANSECQICQTKCSCYVTKPGLDVFGNRFNTNNLPSYECVNCNKTISSSRYAPHLEKCLGLAGRHSSRVASRRLGSASPAHSETELTENKRKKGAHINSSRIYDIKYEAHSDTEIAQNGTKRRREDRSKSKSGRTRQSLSPTIQGEPSTNHKRQKM
ncbi:hypothetical protein BCR42DRAFT_421612 [Absidia repens]|uniref:SAGA-associated factor 11 n=1 Tax=Absidia repens TaxID=90262 RepID=A0A1X2I7M3_9FUNG|nr:hypothetical protein BCR42DRAFT_421612 [Absidia repens]